MTETIQLTLEKAQTLSESALSRCGANEAHARATTDSMMRAEKDRCASHGLFRLPGYCASLKSGKVDGSAVPTLSKIAPSVLRVDGAGGFAPLALETGLPALADVARENGIAALGLIRIHHFAALWPEVETLAEQGLSAMAFTQAAPMVAPAGGIKPFFGTNPMAFSWPRPGKVPFVFDQASAAMARGDVQIHRRDGKPVPIGIGIDKDGKDTTDPAAVLEGAQLPFGGYKGSNIALMVELLAGGLIGSVFSFEAGAIDNKDGGPPVGGEVVIAMDPSRFGDPDSWASHCEGLFAEMEAMKGVRLAGQRRHRSRKETATDGIALPLSLYESVKALAEDG